MDQRPHQNRAEQKGADRAVEAKRNGWRAGEKRGEEVEGLKVEQERWKAERESWKAEQESWKVQKGAERFEQGGRWGLMAVAGSWEESEPCDPVRC